MSQFILTRLFTLMAGPAHGDFSQGNKVPLFLVFMAFMVSVQSQELMTWNQIAKAVLLQSPSFARARAEQHTAEAMLRIQKGEYYPELNLGISATQTEQGPREVYLGAESILQPGQALGYHSAGVDLSYTLFDWGNRSRKKKALLKVQAGKREALVVVKRRVLEDAFNAYTGMLTSGELVELLEEERQLLERRLDLTGKLVDRGIQPAVDIYRVRLELRNLRVEILREKAFLESSRGYLAVMMGLDFTHTFQLAGFEMPEDSLVLSPVNTNGQPLIKELMANLQAARLEAQIAWWQNIPTLNLNTYYQRSNQRFKEVYGNLGQNWNTGISLSLYVPLLDKGVRRSRMENRALVERIAATDLHTEQQRIGQRIHEVEAQLKSHWSVYDLVQRNLEDYETILTFEQEAYEAGRRDFTGYMQAWQSYSSARRSVLTAKQDLLVTFFQYELLMGRWDGIGDF